MKQTLKLSPSILEAWNQYLKGVPYQNTEKIANMILKEFSWSVPMIDGACFHYLIEKYGNWGTDKNIKYLPKIKAIQVYHWQTKTTATFRSAIVEIAEQIGQELRGTDKEVWLDYKVERPKAKVIVRQKVDFLGTFSAGDIKTSQRPFDLVQYSDSMQMKLNALSLKDLKLYSWYFVQWSGSRSLGKHEQFDIPITNQVMNDWEKQANEVIDSFLNWIFTQPKLVNARLYDFETDRNPFKGL